MAGDAVPRNESPSHEFPAHSNREISLRSSAAAPKRTDFNFVAGCTTDNRARSAARSQERRRYRWPFFRVPPVSHFSRDRAEGPVASAECTRKSARAGRPAVARRLAVDPRIFRLAGSQYPVRRGPVGGQRCRWRCPASVVALATLTGWRTPGSRDAFLLGGPRGHAASTAEIDIVAEREDPFDDYRRSPLAASTARVISHSPHEPEPTFLTLTDCLKSTEDGHAPTPDEGRLRVSRKASPAQRPRRERGKRHQTRPSMEIGARLKDGPGCDIHLVALMLLCVRADHVSRATIAVGDMQ